jgi:hypothetical protein
MIALLKSLRQWCYPKEFRIAAPVWPPDMLTALQRLSNEQSGAMTPASDNEACPDLLANVATKLWRLRQKMLQPGTDQPLEEMRGPYRSFESAWDTLTQAGVEILDHTGTQFNSGLLLRVLAFQPTPGIILETVIETIKPTIYYKQQLLQTGEVIVGIPETPVNPLTELTP